MTLRKVFLIDGTAFCYRAFYAIRLLSTADGRATNAVYGVGRMLQSLREKERPDYLAVAFAVGKPTFRHRQFEEYKVQRKPMPDALIAQLPLVKTLLAAYRVPVFEQEGFEGEDVLATITHALARPGLQVFLVTGDKDALQLVSSHVLVYNPHKKDDPVLGADAVRARRRADPALRQRRDALPPVGGGRAPRPPAEPRAFAGAGGVGARAGAHQDRRAVLCRAGGSGAPRTGLARAPAALPRPGVQAVVGRRRRGSAAQQPAGGHRPAAGHRRGR